jgi:hypothetical protein
VEQSPPVDACDRTMELQQAVDPKTLFSRSQFACVAPLNGFAWMLLVGQP